MTLKLSRFRVGRAALEARGRRPAETPAAPSPSAPAPADSDDGFGERIYPTAAQPGAMVPPRATVSAAVADAEAVEAERAAIRAEGLTARQLRMARRVADRHAIEVDSDFEAVRQLRRRGIDPFRHGNMLELVLGASPGAQTLPQKAGQQALAQPRSDEATRAQEILRIQRDIAWRRKKRLAAMVLRLTALILLPTILAGYYFYRLATPMYATYTEFVIQQAQPQVMPAGNPLQSSPLATMQDSINVQSYLQSREAMLRLEDALGFKAHYADPAIDPIQRLPAAATNEDTYEIYQKMVRIGFDPTEGIVRMEVIAPDPQLSEAFSKALLSYAEERVDQMTKRLRDDQMAGARATYEEAEAKVLAAQQRYIALQERRGIISADAEISLLMTQISGFESELQRERLALQQFLENPSPNATRVSAARANIARLDDVIAGLRAQLTESTGGSDSLARVTGELMIAESELQTRQALLAQSLEQMETARIEANRQVRYLSTGVSPVAPDRAAYPRAFENTAITLLILTGIYLLVSITVSILREQVSA